MYNRLHWALRLLVLIGLGVLAYFISDDFLLLTFILLVPTIIINLTTDAGGTGVIPYIISHIAFIALAWFAPELDFLGDNGGFIVAISGGFVVIWDMVFTMVPSKLKNGIVYDIGIVVWLVLPALIYQGVVGTALADTLYTIVRYGSLIAWGVYILFLIFGGFFSFDGGSKSSGSSSGGSRRATRRDVERAGDKCRSRFGSSIRIGRISESGGRMDVYLDVPQYTDNSSVSNFIQHLGGYLSDLDTDHIYFHY